MTYLSLHPCEISSQSDSFKIVSISHTCNLANYPHNKTCDKRFISRSLIISTRKQEKICDFHVSALSCPMLVGRDIAEMRNSWMYNQSSHIMVDEELVLWLKHITRMQLALCLVIIMLNDFDSSIFEMLWERYGNNQNDKSTKIIVFIIHYQTCMTWPCMVTTLVLRQSKLLVMGWFWAGAGQHWPGTNQSTNQPTNESSACWDKVTSGKFT